MPEEPGAQSPQGSEATEAPDTPSAPEPTSTQEGPKASPAPPRTSGRQRAAEIGRKWMESRETAEPETTEEAPPETTEAEEAPSGEAPTTARDGMPAPESDRHTEGMPSGFYLEQSTGRVKRADNHRYVSPSDPALQGISLPEGSAADDGEPGPPEAAGPEGIPEGYERVDLPPDHPLREQGLEYVTLPGPEVVGEQQYRALRSGLNNHVRNRELEQTREQLRAMRRREAEKAARDEITQTDEFRRLDPEQNAELKEQIEDHRRTYGDDSAELLLDALEEKRKNLLRQAEESAQEQAAWDDHAARFQQVVSQQAARAFPVWAETGELESKVIPLAAKFARLVDAGQAPPDPRAFFQWAFWNAYAHDPRVQQRARENGTPQQDASGQIPAEAREQLKAELRAEVREELKAEERERVTDSVRRRSRSTAGHLPSSDVGARTDLASEGDELDRSSMSPDQIRKAEKENLKKRMRERFAGAG